MPTAAPSGHQQVFHRSASARTTGTLLVLGGVGGLVFAVVAFVVAILGRTSTLVLHGTTTLPTIISIGALTAGWTLLRAPRRVVVGSEGLTIETRHDVRTLPWDEIGSGAVETGGMNQRRCLNITGLGGTSIIKLDESFERFDEMAALISGYITAKGDDTAERIVRKKARRQGLIAFATGAFLSTAAVFVGWHTYQEQRAARLLQERGQPGEAEILRRFLAPNGVTRRVEYRVAGSGGQSATRNVEVESQYWDRLKDARTIPVLFLPDEPSVSRLARGEVHEDDFTKTPAGGYALAGLGGAMALFVLAISPFLWNGWDLAFDSKTQKWSLKRYGQVVWSSRGASDKPPWLPKGL